jgi:hypothetical protein
VNGKSSARAKRDLVRHLQICPDRSFLLDQCHFAASWYSQAATALSIMAGNAGTSQYQELLAAARAARRKAEDARKALLDHMREHGCKTEVDGWQFDLR